MNQHVRQIDLTQLAFAAIAAIMPDKIEASDLPEPLMGLADAVAIARLAPTARDRAMVDLANALDLTSAELLAMAVLAAVEIDPQACRNIALCQSPVGGPRPLLGLLATAFAGSKINNSAIFDLASGQAMRSGCFRLGPEDVPLPERSLALSIPVLQCLLGQAHSLPGLAILHSRDAPLLPQSLRAQIEGWCATLTSRPHSGLVIRSANDAECNAVAVQFARTLGLQPVLISGALPDCVSPWLIAAKALPVFAANALGAERKLVPSLAPYSGPWLCVADRHDIINFAGQTVFNWSLPIPNAQERIDLWQAKGFSADLARRAAIAFRHGPARIAEIATATASWTTSSGDTPATWDDLGCAIMAQSHIGLAGLAERLDGSITDQAFIAPASLRQGLGMLLGHCRLREGLGKGLGPATLARYRPGVRALFYGASGTGKSLAAQWLASRLSMPIFRADLASLTSKWIGETEKNLGQLLSAAEAADVILLFDEADALFGARTDVSSANDKFANSQTNYLLQRLETHEGIVILTCNGRDRLDSAFTRRLDSILEFPIPDAQARLDIWRAHLGEGKLESASLNRLAANIDLAGGHIRNIVLAAAVVAGTAECPLNLDHIITAATAEYNKLGRSLPREFG